MKLRVGCVMLMFFSLVLSMTAQVGGSGTTNYIPIWTASSTLGDSTIFQTGGKVGIHTVTPSATLTVKGPNGKPNKADAPTVLQVTGGAGANEDYAGGGGGSISLQSGAGGSGNHNGGAGGSITLTGGNGGDSFKYGGGGGSITLQPGSGGYSGNVILALPTGGAVGIGETSPAATLDVVAGGTTLADAWTVRSSRRFKTDIQPLEGALERVEQLQGVSYERKSDGQHEIGVVAEDVAQIVPEVVSRDPKTHEVQGVDYSRLAVLLIEAVKSQQAEIQELKMQILQLTSSRTGN
jgi:hypothetical protein